MNQTVDSGNGQLPPRISRVRTWDKRFQRLAIGAWGTTMVLIAVLVLYEIVNIRMVHSMISGDGGPGLNDLVLILDRWAPVVRTFAVLTLVVGLASTFVVFLRFRTSSLGEIQARLRAIEDTLIEKGR